MKISENLQKKEKVLSLRQERGDQLYLNERCISIIKILLENGNINIIDLAEKFEISGRSIRYDIDNIDFIFTAENIKLLKKDKNGIFTLETNDKKEIERIIQTYSVLSSEERIVYLMVKLLTENIINLTLEAKNLEVSRSTLKTDYNILKNYLENAGIKIITLSNKGLSILGREEDIRKIFIKCFMNLLTQKMALKSTLKNLINDLYEKVDIEKVKIFINKIQTDFN
ncbi:MAG: helix-turn-helix domain-containing protein, partial [Fusobacterium sp.]